MFIKPSNFFPMLSKAQRWARFSPEKPFLGPCETLARLLERATMLGSIDPKHHLFPAANFRHTNEGQKAGSGFDPTRAMKSWRSAWRALTRKAGLTGLRFHDLRHHCITRLAEAGVAEQTLMAIAGHVSREMLEHYSHIRMQAKREAVA